MALIDFTGFENLNTTAGATPDNWSYGTMFRATTAGQFYTGAAGARNTDNGAGTEFRRSLTASEEHATIITGYWFKPDSMFAARILAEFYSDTGTTLHGYFQLNADGSVAAYSVGTLRGTSATGLLFSGAWKHLEFKFVLGDSPNGAMYARVDGVSVLSVTGIDTKNAGTKTVIDQIRGPRNANSSDNLNMDDWFLVNGDTSDAEQPSDWQGVCRVYAIRPTADASVAFTPSTGSNYACVDETDFTVGTDYVEAVADSLTDLYTMGDVSLPSGSTPLGVKVSTIALNSSAGTRTIAQKVKSGATTVTKTAQTLSTTAKIFEYVVAKDPNTSDPWTESNINSIETGFVSGS
jgi:hypothetical protein